MISAIISSFNEAHNAIFWKNVELLNSSYELIVVDGGSRDETVERLRALRIEPHILPDSNRARRYNYGIELARNRFILLVHPRSELHEEALRELAGLEGDSLWGAFRHSFDLHHPVLSFTSWYSNFVRGRGRSIYYLDHCLFFTKDLKEHARFPDVPLFEDTYFCANLRRQAKPRLLTSKVKTSAVRFRKNGIYRQALMNQALKVMFHLGVPTAWMTRIYERGLRLND